jgi:hypothetical protein
MLAAELVVHHLHHFFNGGIELGQLGLRLLAPGELEEIRDDAVAGMDTFRVMFFVLTFFTIGVVSNFKKLWEEGIGRLAAVYVLCLFGFIIWVGLLISWIFFHGVHPPIITG